MMATPPEATQKSSKTPQNTNHRHHHNRKKTVLQKIRAHNNQQPLALLADASADGGTLDVAPFPQIESKLPPRMYTCRCYPLVKYAFATRGFTMKQHQDDYKNAWIIWKTGTDIDMESLLPWQRPSHFPGERLMDRKGTMYQVLRQYSLRQNVPLDFVPETFILYDDKDKNRFVERLDNGGMDMPWVLKRSKASRGRGVTMLGPHSTELRTLRDELEDGPNKTGHIIQSYIRNEWTFQGHKCDLRVYVLVASIQPLIVYYHDGIVRTAIGLHNEEDFGESKAHLTNVSQNKQNRTAWEPVKMFDQLDTELQEYSKREGAKLNISDPINHIRNQIKRILGVVFASFKSRISLNDLPIDNAFALMGKCEYSCAVAVVVSKESSALTVLHSISGADFVIDKDLKVWLLEMQLGPQLVGESHAKKTALLQEVITTTIDVVEEVFHKQERKEPLLPLSKASNFDLVYFDQSYQFETFEE
eukprot:scaffold3784_cov174-Amphora_coffeaeformis.AAC.2